MRESLLSRFDHRTRDGLIRIQRLFAAAENCRVAGFEAKNRGIGGYVWTRFVNDDNNADWGADFLKFEAVGPDTFIEHFADRVGEHGDLAQAFGHSSDAFVVQ